MAACSRAQGGGCGEGEAHLIGQVDEGDQDDEGVEPVRPVREVPELNIRYVTNT